jgi:hypothetical protein
MSDTLLTEADIEEMRRRGLSWQEQNKLCDMALKALELERELRDRGNRPPTGDIGGKS